MDDLITKFIIMYINMGYSIVAAHIMAVHNCFEK